MPAAQLPAPQAVTTRSKSTIFTSLSKLNDENLELNCQHHQRINLKLNYDHFEQYVQDYINYVAAPFRPHQHQAHSTTTT
eukprot:2867706-Amphidinium_carterae.1